MKATELMIGDWVKTDRMTIRIEGIGRGAVEHDCGYYHNLDELIPIPLTTDILKTNGFELIKNNIEPTHIGKFCWARNGLMEGYTADVAVDYNRLELADKCEDIFILYAHLIKGKHLQYVHELQHALRLCNLNDLADNLEIETLSTKHIMDKVIGVAKDLGL